MRIRRKRTAARPPEEQPADDGDDREHGPQRRERNQRVVGRRQRDRGFLAVQLLCGPGAGLKLTLDLGLPRTKLGIRGNQGDERSSTEQISPKPGRIGQRRTSFGGWRRMIGGGSAGGHGALFRITGRNLSGQLLGDLPLHPSRSTHAAEFSTPGNRIALAA